MWFTETSWPPIIICCVLAVLLVADWYNTGRGRNLVGVGLLGVLSLAIYVIEINIVTDRERVQANVHGMASAFQQGDLERTLEYVSQNATQIRAVITAAHGLVRVRDDLRVTDVKVELMSNNSRAVSRFRANASIAYRSGGDLGRHPSYWELTWQREGAEWRVIRVKRLNPVNGEEMGFLDRTPS